MKKKERIAALEALVQRLAVENAIMADALERSRINFQEQFEKRADLN